MSKVQTRVKYGSGREHFASCPYFHYTENKAKNHAWIRQPVDKNASGCKWLTLQSRRLPVRFIVMSIIDECGIFNRLSSVGNTDFDLVTLRNCRLNPSMAFMGSISVRTSCGYLKQMDNFGRFASRDCAISGYYSFHISLKASNAYIPPLRGGREYKIKSGCNENSSHSPTDTNI